MDYNTYLLASLDLQLEVATELLRQSEVERVENAAVLLGMGLDPFAIPEVE